MKNTYAVEFAATTFRTYEVEASSEDEAEALAFDRLESDPYASSAWRKSADIHNVERKNMFNTTHYEDKIPPLVLAALVRWGKQETLVGDFLMAFLSNDLRAAIERSGEIPLAAFRHIMLFARNELPFHCHGSLKKVEAWENEIYKNLEMNNDNRNTDV